MTTLKADQAGANPKSNSSTSELPRLLVIDDDPAVRKLFRFRLKDAYEIVDTGSPEDALALALQDRPDAILLDLSMPGYSGFEVCQALASLSFTQGIPIVIVSGKSKEEDKELCESLGATAFFQKPVDIDLLKKTLARLIEGRVRGKQVEPRVRLKITLTLRGTDSNGRVFVLPITTDDVGANDFRSVCSVPLKKGAIVAVHFTQNDEAFIGKARVSHVESAGTPAQRCDFHFTEKPGEWILR
jgi:CheY-like chemotaxis protein